MSGPCLALAALVLAATALAHSWLGERRLIGPLLAPGSRPGPLAGSAYARQVLRFAWHVTSLTWLGLGGMLLALAPAPPAGPAGHAVLAAGATFLVLGLVSAVAGRGRHLSWVAFLLAAGLCLAAALP